MLNRTIVRIFIRIQFAFYKMTEKKTQICQKVDSKKPKLSAQALVFEKQ